MLKRREFEPFLVKSDVDFVLPLVDKLAAETKLLGKDI
jgi:hypothetical protein